MIDRIVIATQNPAKRNRYQRLLAPYVKGIVSLADLGLIDKPQEKGETAEENATIKAKFYCAQSQLPVLSEDEALYVDFLPPDQQPSVHVRRIEGRDEASDEALLEHWEKIIEPVPADSRTGHWHIAYALALPNGTVSVVSLNHSIVFFSPSSKVRLPGWPMSSLEGPVGFNKPHSELTPEEHDLNNKQADQEIIDKIKELFQ